MEFEDGRPEFDDTQWSLIGAAKSDDPVERSRALDTLCQTYCPPVYHFLRRKGQSPERACELTQAFFTEKILGGDLFERADHTAGRLRSLLRTAVQRFAIDAQRSDVTRKKHEAKYAELIRAEEKFVAQFASLTAEQALDQRFVMLVLQEAIGDIEGSQREAGRQLQWQVFSRIFLDPIRGNVTAPSQAEVAREFGLASPQLVADWKLEGIRKLKSALRIRVATIVDDPADVDDEIRRFFDVLGGG